METKLLNKLSPEAREFVIMKEAELRKLDEEILELELIEEQLDNGEGLLFK
jgi:hypothetical protein